MTRFTATQLREMARVCESSDYELDEAASMLRQAADDAESLAGIFAADDERKKAEKAYWDMPLTRNPETYARRHDEALDAVWSAIDADRSGEGGWGMSMLEDLGKAREAAALYEAHGVLPAWAKVAMVEFLRDHGLALLEALRDAERYRWLRDASDFQIEVFIPTDKNPSGWGAWHSCTDKDAAIDAARKENT